MLNPIIVPLHVVERDNMVDVKLFERSQGRWIRIIRDKSDIPESRFNLCADYNQLLTSTDPGSPACSAS